MVVPIRVPSIDKKNLLKNKFYLLGIHTYIYIYIYIYIYMYIFVVGLKRE